MDPKPKTHPDPTPEEAAVCPGCARRKRLMASITDPKIDVPDDVAVWFRQMIDAGVEFHPEDSFADMISADTGEPSFAPEVAARMDEAMRKACRFFQDASRLACAIDPQVPSTIL